MISHESLYFVLSRICLNKQPLPFRGFCSSVSGGLFCIELVRTRQGIEFTRLHSSFVFQVIK